MPRRALRLQNAAAAVVTVTFVVFFVGGAVGLIGEPDEVRADLSGLDDRPVSSAPEVVWRAGDVADRHLSILVPNSTPSPRTTATPSPSLIAAPVPTPAVSGAQELQRDLASPQADLVEETTFGVASLNVLGSSHTAPGGNREGFASGTSRMDMAWSLISSAGVSVVGFQELEEPQYDRMLALSGWTAFPGPTLDRGSIRNSVAWDPDVWQLVEARSVGIPYFGGMVIRRPVVRLENRGSGRQVWFFNTHNPATTPKHGDNAHWRAAAISIEVALANALRADGTPVVFTGDFNDREAAFCPLVGGTALEAANGGAYEGECTPPDRMDVDWIFGTGIEWSDFSATSAGVVGRVSDHPFVQATAHIPQSVLYTVDTPATRSSAPHSQ